MKPTDSEREAMAKRLDNARLTMTNDDTSQQGTEKRARFINRLDAMGEAAAMLRAMKGRVRVKPLEWRAVADGRMALSPVGPYRVLEQPDGFFDVMFDGCLVNQRKKGEAFRSYEAAEEWAQTRHHKQVTDCLSAPDQGEWDAAIEAAAKVAENCFLIVAPETVSQRVGTESNRAAIAAAIRNLKKGNPND